MNKVLLLVFLHSVFLHAHDPFIVVLMVKNEEAVIEKTLEPFVQEHLNSFLIFDTGSTDNTIDVVRSFFEHHHVSNWHVLQEPFIDFATSRNHALEHAEALFPQASFLLMPDAEWYLHNVKELMEFCREYQHDDAQCYLIRIINQRLDFVTARLIRAHVNARFAGKVHESVVAQQVKKIPATIFFELGASKSGIEKSRQRWQRDLLILRTEHEEHPADPRTTFYLAQTYECLGDLENAYAFYALRAQQPGWIEETYEALYRLGRVTDMLSQNNKQYTWHMAYDYYAQAHNLLPHRAEPLIKIAEHYWPEGLSPENIALCYVFAKRAYELPYPEHDLLFIDPDVYNFRRYELLSKAAWYVGDLALGEVCTRKALQHRVTTHLLRNLAWYLERKIVR